MKNLTKLFCDLLSVGSQLGDTEVSTEQILSNITSSAVHRLPEDCDVSLDAIAEHIEDVRSAMCQSRSAYGKPLSIRDIVEFHGKLTVKLNDGSELTFDSSEVTHY